jgi:glycosyltransferase involved in cell wall biosynthesis
MKILFINTFDTRGGAAMVVHNLKEYIKVHYKLDVITIVGEKTQNDPNVLVSRNRVQRFIEKFINKVLNALGFQYQYFPFTSAFVLKQIRIFQPDVISLHNTHGGYFATPLIKKVAKYAHVVWTLHDMWSFTGNSAHTFGDEGWRVMKNPKSLTKVEPRIGLNNGGFLLKQKRKIYSESDLTIVAPSRWLYDLAITSPVFANKELYHILNGIDLCVFEKKNKMQVRAFLGIPATANVLMFSADVLKNNPWKGGDELLNALRIINSESKQQIHLIISGSGEILGLDALTGFVVHRTGFITNREKMAEFLSASDLLLYPTKADNLPTVLIEAIACGLPCIASNVGGCSEIVVDGFNGILIEPNDYKEMASATLNLLEDKDRIRFFSVNARLHAERFFSIEKMAREYHGLFLSKITRQFP